MPEPIRLIIADDEPLAISNLAAKLASHADVDIVACFDNGDDTLAYLHQHPVDLVLLDIQMPGLKGTEVLQRLQKQSALTPPLLVLVTAYEQYAYPAFAHFAFDYLLKPVSRERLAKCLNDARLTLGHTLGHSPNATTTVDIQRLAFKTGSSTVWLDDTDIQLIEAAGNYMCVQTARDNLIVRETIKDLLQRLPAQFVQIHRSSLVNLHHVHKICSQHNDYLLTLSSGKVIAASRRYKQNWLHKLKL